MTLDKKAVLSLSRDPLARMMASRPEGLVALFAARLLQEDMVGEGLYPAAYVRGLYKAAGRDVPTAIKDDRRQAISLHHKDIYDVFLAAAGQIDPHLRDGYIAKARQHPYVIVHIIDSPELAGRMMDIESNADQYRATLEAAGEKSSPALTRLQTRNYAVLHVIQDFAREHQLGTELDPDYHVVTNDKYLFIRCSAEFAEELWKCKPPGFGGYGYAPPPHTRPAQALDFK